MQIGEIAKLTGLSISKLRYYDKQGLLPNLNRTSSGKRNFKKEDIDTLKMINCLKTAGMKISEIKQFMKWCSEGDKTIENRLNMFYEQEKNINKQIEELTKSLKLIKFKQWYYKQAKLDGTIKNVKNMTLDDMPKDIAELYKETH